MSGSVGANHHFDPPQGIPRIHRSPSPAFLQPTPGPRVSNRADSAVPFRGTATFRQRRQPSHPNYTLPMLQGHVQTIGSFFYPTFSFGRLPRSDHLSTLIVQAHFNLSDISLVPHHGANDGHAHTCCWLKSCQNFTGFVRCSIRHSWLNAETADAAAPSPQLRRWHSVLNIS